MNIILLEDIDKVGEKFQVAAVKNGYARNYLIPQKMAIIANRTNLAKLSDYKNREAKKEEKARAIAQGIADKLSGQVLKIGAKAGTSGKIFGSVTTVQIAQALKEQLELDIERRKIEIEGDVKELGMYTAVIHLHKDVDTRANFEVVRD